MTDLSFREIHDKFETAKQLLDIPKNATLSSKLQYLDKIQIKDRDLVFGITPSDFYIRFKLNLIDTQGIKKNFDRFQDELFQS